MHAHCTSVNGTHGPLIKQLRELGEDSLVTRTVYPVVPPKAVAARHCLPGNRTGQRLRHRSTP
ncbi:winged helix-turn-helix transcriptional regulator [Streptomyces sp. NPDC051985]|uniref:winged helix-turn-helix transcriptional regulator n=1 Tax=Streptomyces sp. NPDC051985 TaxID=3155807 RepID=UPI0034424EF0